MKISICTTTARSGFVSMQAKMLANQTYKDIEWVLIDFDYDRRAEAMLELSRELNLNLVHMPNVQGGPTFFRDITRNRNKALKYATGVAVIFLDDYAVIPNDYVEKHIEILKTNCLSAGLMHRLERPTDEQVYALLPDKYEAIFSHFKNSMGKDYRDRDGTSYKSSGITYTGNLGIPRIVFEHLNGFDPRMESGLEDCDFGMRSAMANFPTFYNPSAYTINLSTDGIPYTYSFDHTHDVEPFISNPNNNFWGDAKLEENEFMKVAFHPGYRVAQCKKCGAQGMIDPNELMSYKDSKGEFKVPAGIPGGFDDPNL